MHQYPCSDDRLRVLLQADDDSDDLRQSAEHVDQCPRCQARLEELAAEPAEWQIVKHSLLSRDDNSTHEHPVEGPRPWVRDRRPRHSAAWTDSMARQLLSPPSHPEMLGRIGRYEVERLIGIGGMGVVFKAFDTELNRPVAVKVLAPHLAGSGAARKRFSREARAAAAVVHEHVVAIHNVETEGASPFLVMPYVAGESLQQRIDRRGPLELCEILRIAMQTAAGLAAAHAQGLVHRDVKPSNILLEQGIERTLLTDFGLARASDDASLTHTGYHPGTPQYMSPEQARGDSVDARSDVFSLGSVIYTMSTGRPPFRAETNYGVLRRITDSDPRPIREVNPSIPEWFEGLVSRLLAKDITQRFQTAREVAELLEQCLAHVQQPTSTALPAACRTFGRSGHGLKSAWTWSAIHRQWTRTSPRGRIAACLCGTVPFVLMTSSALNQFFAPRDPPDANKPVSGTASDLPDGRLSYDTADWDATAANLNSIAQDLAPFETRSQDLWDNASTLPEE